MKEGAQKLNEDAQESKGGAQASKGGAAPRYVALANSLGVYKRLYNPHYHWIESCTCIQNYNSEPVTPHQKNEGAAQRDYCEMLSAITEPVMDRHINKKH